MRADWLKSANQLPVLFPLFFTCARKHFQKSGIERQQRTLLIFFGHTALQSYKDIYKDIISIFFNIKVCCVFSLKSPHRGDSIEYTQHTISINKRKITLNYPKSAAVGISQGAQERVRKSRGRRAISVRATKFCCI